MNVKKWNTIKIKWIFNIRQINEYYKRESEILVWFHRFVVFCSAFIAVNGKFYLNVTRILSFDILSYSCWKQIINLCPTTQYIIIISQYSTHTFHNPANCLNECTPKYTLYKCIERTCCQINRMDNGIQMTYWHWCEQFNCEISLLLHSYGVWVNKREQQLSVTERHSKASNFGYSSDLTVFIEPFYS